MIPTLPTQAGPVLLDFSIAHERPERPLGVTNRLNLPIQDGMRFTSLKGGEQFLVEYRPGQIWSQAVFGGNDESAFLTGVDTAAANTLNQYGEAAFFDALTPRVIRDLRKKFPDEEIHRQGDIWAISLPTTWDELGAQFHPNTLQPHQPKRARKKMRSYLKKNWRSFQPERQVGSKGVLDTNHALKGHCVRKDGYRFAGINLGICVFAEGVLTAIDHAPLRLLGRPYVLARTPHLVPWGVLNGE